MTMEAEREAGEEDPRRPLLPPSPSPAAEHQQQYEHLGRSSSSAQRGGGGGWAEVSAAEVKSAAPFSSTNYYPPAPNPHHDAVYPPPSTAHHDAVYPPPSTAYHDAVYPPPSTAHHDAVYPPPSTAATPPYTHGLEIVPQGPYPDGGYYEPSQDVRRDVLDEVEARRLLIEHVGHRCCWGSRPARTWKITSIKDCSDVYVGTLETFIEQRDEILQKEPYDGGEVDGRDKGPVLGVWELDLRSEFPMLFVPEKEVMVKIPHSQATEKCSKCQGRGEAPCPICNPGRQLGFYITSQMIKCSLCDGRGLRTQQDGSDSVCWRCNGQGMLPCTACGSRGVVVCQKCNGCGSLLAQSIARVQWRTLTARKVSATAGSASVPDEVFHRAQGVQLCNIRAYQCTPAFFADSYPLSLLSSEVVVSRLPVPPSAIVHLERHIISVVPVTRVTMSDRKRSFSFYVVGYGRDVFVRDYPSRFCWGLCRCFEWLWN